MERELKRALTVAVTIILQKMPLAKSWGIVCLRFLIPLLPPPRPVACLGRQTGDPQLYTEA